MHNEIQKLLYKAKQICPEASDEVIEDIVIEYLLKKATIFGGAAIKVARRRSKGEVIKSIMEENPNASVFEILVKKQPNISEPDINDHGHKSIEGISDSFHGVLRDAAKARKSGDHEAASHLEGIAFGKKLAVMGIGYKSKHGNVINQGMFHPTYSKMSKAYDKHIKEHT